MQPCLPGVNLASECSADVGYDYHLYSPFIQKLQTTRHERTYALSARDGTGTSEPLMQQLSFIHVVRLGSELSTSFNASVLHRDFLIVLLWRQIALITKQLGARWI